MDTNHYYAKYRARQYKYDFERPGLTDPEYYNEFRMKPIIKLSEKEEKEKMAKFYETWYKEIMDRYEPKFTRNITTNLKSPMGKTALNCYPSQK